MAQTSNFVCGVQQCISNEPMLRASCCVTLYWNISVLVHNTYSISSIDMGLVIGEIYSLSDLSSCINLGSFRQFLGLPGGVGLNICHISGTDASSAWERRLNKCVVPLLGKPRINIGLLIGIWNHQQLGNFCVIQPWQCMLVNSQVGFKSRYWRHCHFSFFNFWFSRTQIKNMKRKNQWRITSFSLIKIQLLFMY